MLEMQILIVFSHDKMFLKRLAFSEGDVACFSEYMEMWIHSARIEGLVVWLSGATRIQGKSSDTMKQQNIEN